MIIRNLLNLSVYFWNYETIYELLSPQQEIYDQNRRKIWWKSVIAGGCAGSVAWAVMYPLDTFKTLALTDSFENPKYKNYFDLVKKVY